MPRKPRKPKPKPKPPYNWPPKLVIPRDVRTVSFITLPNYNERYH